MKVIKNFFSQNWKYILVLTVLLLIYHHDYISHLLNMGSSAEVAGGLLGMLIGNFIVATIFMILARLVERGFSKM